MEAMAWAWALRAIWGMHPRWGMVLLREVKREGAKEPYSDVWQEKGQGLCAVLGGVLGSFLG